MRLEAPHRLVYQGKYNVHRGFGEETIPCQQGLSAKGKTVTEAAVAGGNTLGLCGTGLGEAREESKAMRGVAEEAEG